MTMKKTTKDEIITKLLNHADVRNEKDDYMKGVILVLNYSKQEKISKQKLNKVWHYLNGFTDGTLKDSRYLNLDEEVLVEEIKEMEKQYKYYEFEDLEFRAYIMKIVRQTPTKGWIETFLTRHNLKAIAKTPLNRKRFENGNATAIKGWFLKTDPNDKKKKIPSWAIFNADETIVAWKDKFKVICSRGTKQAIVAIDKDTEHVTFMVTISVHTLFFILKLFQEYLTNF
eukprot:gene2361-2829_t